jgi:ABC-2 type transport system ATP-binding protein
VSLITLNDAEPRTSAITLNDAEPRPSASGSPRLIEARRLVRRFGPTVAVADISLDVASGELLALLGPNGAGKTTTLQMLAGLLPPSEGRAMVAGHDVTRDAREVRARVGLMVDEPGFYPEMTIVEYLLFMARLYKLEKTVAMPRIDEMLHRFDLVAKRDARLSSLSKGMRQKVALTRALIHLPPVLLLDEPTSALDPLSARAVHEYIAERRSAGDAIILSTHQLAEAEVLADRVVVIANGRVLREGTWTDLRRPADGLEIFVITIAGPARPEVLANVTAAEGARDVRLVDGADDRHRVTYRTAAPDMTNAAITAALARNCMSVLALEPRPRSLSAVYLDTLRDAAAIS